MILGNKLNLIFCLFLASCMVKAQDITTCQNYYKENELEKCFVCTKEYLESNPTDIVAMSLAIKCAQSEDELAFVNKHMKLQYNRNSNLFKGKIEFWIANGNLHMKMKDSMRAYLCYSAANNIDSNVIGLSYKLALSDLAWYNEVKDNTNRTKTDKISALNNILNHLNRELLNNPNDSASLALKKRIEALLNTLQR